MAGLRTLALELVRQMKVDNIAAQLELFQDDFPFLIITLKKLQFL